jgi:hypothetical protein
MTASGESSALHAGAAAVDITPPMGAQVAGSIGARRPASEVVDPLYCRVLVLAQGDQLLCVVAADVLAIRCDYATETRRRINAATGIPAAHIMVHATQNHSSPSVGHCFCLDESFWRQWVPDDLEWVLGCEPAYNTLFLDRATAAASRALAAIQPVTVHAGRAIEGRVAHNRRAILRDGTAVMHPPIGDPNILQLEGPIDPEVGVVSLRTADGEDLATLLHYSSHPQADVGWTSISAAWPGAWCREMAAILSPDAVPLVANGCCGNLHLRNPLNDTQVTDVEAGRLLAEASKQALARLADAPPPAAAPVLRTVSTTVHIPLRTLDPQLVADAWALLDAHPTPIWLDDSQTRIDWSWIYAISRLDLARYCEEHDHFAYEVQAFRIGDVALLALTGEPFVEGQLEIKLRSPAAHTLIAHMSNGYVGYIPTAAAIARGGYETETAHWSKLVPEALQMIVDRSVAVLDELFADDGSTC